VREPGFKSEGGWPSGNAYHHDLGFALPTNRYAAPSNIENGFSSREKGEQRTQTVIQLWLNVSNLSVGSACRQVEIGFHYAGTPCDPRRDITLARFVTGHCWRDSCGPRSGFRLQNRLEVNWPTAPVLFRRERAMPDRNLLKRCDTDGYRRHVQ